MKNIIFVAPPSSGKGTQSDLLADEFGYIHLSTGDILRREIATGSTLGMEIDKLISKGEFVSDEIITDLIAKEISSTNQKFILDGYPRNINQAEILDKMFIDLGIDNYIVIYLDISREEALSRVVGRLVCEDCGATFNINYEHTKPIKEGNCDKCNHELIKRKDDNEETFNKRFDKFMEITSPLIEYYENKGCLVKIKVANEKQETFDRIVKVLEKDN